MSTLYGISHNNEDLTIEQIHTLIEYVGHQNAEIRLSLVHCLFGIETEPAIRTLIELSKDDDPSIRDWATFGLGTQLEIKSEVISNALWDRVNDENQEVKLEAIVGLAIRGDKGIKEIIINELKRGEHSTVLYDAIEYLNDKSILSHLERQLQNSLKDPDIPQNWLTDLESTIKLLKDN